MIASLYRILTIGRNTLTEAVRQKVLNVLLIFALLLICASVGIQQIVTPGLENTTGLYDAQIKFIKDLGAAAIDIFGFLIALLSTSLLIPQELHNRTIYTILAKPVRRSEFLLGKFFGVVLLLALCVTLMSIAFTATMYWQESQDISATTADYDVRFKNNWHDKPEVVTAYNHDISELTQQTRDPEMIEVIVLLFSKMVMVAGIALLISTFATSWIFTVVTTFLIYLIGHMENTAREFWLSRGAELSIWQSSLVGMLSLLIPDMDKFTIVDEILANNRVPWSHTLNLLGYSNVYLIVILALSVVVFNYREV